MVIKHYRLMNTCKRKKFIDSLTESGEWKTQLAA